MAKEIVLNTKTAIDEIEATEEGKLLKEARGLYEIEFAVVLPLVPGHLVLYPWSSGPRTEGGLSTGPKDQGESNYREGWDDSVGQVLEWL